MSIVFAYMVKKSLEINIPTIPRWFSGRGVNALDYEAVDLGSIHGSGGLPTGYSVLGGSLTGYCYRQYLPRLDNRGGN